MTTHEVRKTILLTVADLETALETYFADRQCIVRELNLSPDKLNFRVQEKGKTFVTAFDGFKAKQCVIEALFPGKELDSCYKFELTSDREGGMTLELGATLNAKGPPNVGESEEIRVSEHSTMKVWEIILVTSRGVYGEEVRVSIGSPGCGSKDFSLRLGGFVTYECGSLGTYELRLTDINDLRRVHLFVTRLK